MERELQDEKLWQALIAEEGCRRGEECKSGKRRWGCKGRLQGGWDEVRVYMYEGKG